MAQSRLPTYKYSTDNFERFNRRPVHVKVNRVYNRQINSTDVNNNLQRVIIHPVNLTNNSGTNESTTLSSSFDLPVVSLCYALLQVFLYVFREQMGVTSEEVVYVSWDTVVTKGETWRLFCAQFFHFGRVQIFFNMVTLMGIGKFLETKINTAAFAVLILALSVISNLMYIFINDMLCSGPNNDFTVGFGTAMFSLRMIHIFTMDSTANNGKGDPNLIFGFLPVHLPQFISPWQPVIETIFFDIFVIGRCVAATVSGMAAGLLFPYLMKEYRSFIMLPRSPPPPPPRIRSRRSVFLGEDENNNEDE